jgi:hypothetical protein
MRAEPRWLASAALAGVLACSRASDPSAQSAFDAPRAPAADGGEHATYFVRDGVLHDRYGEPVVLRGVNHPTLYVDRKGAAFAAAREILRPQCFELAGLQSVGRAHT